MKKYIYILALPLLNACSTIAVQPTPSLIPENLLTRCSDIPKYSEYSNNSKLIADHLKYTEHLMEEFGNCAVSKDNLIAAVRQLQKDKDQPKK